jgi:hypothetical protein
VTAPLQLFARVQVLSCCRECERQVIHCPTCGSLYYRRGSTPREQTITCSCAPGVETLITVEWAGYVPNPTGEAPPKVLGDDLKRLERCLQRRAADRAAWSMPTPPRPKAPPTMAELRRQVGAPPAVAHRRPPAAPPAAPAPAPRPRPSKQPKLLDLIQRDPALEPCPLDEQRWPLAAWERAHPDAFRWLGATFAGAFRRLYGAEPRYGRAPKTGTRAYSSREAWHVAAALAAAERARAEALAGEARP